MFGDRSLRLEGYDSQISRPRQRSPMQIEVKGRNLQVTDELREYVERRFEKIGKQVPNSPMLELEVADENVPGDPIAAAEATLHLKGTHAARQGGLARTPSTRSTSSRTTWSARSSATATSAAGGASRGPPRDALRSAPAPTLEEGARRPVERPPAARSRTARLSSSCPSSSAPCGWAKRSSSRPTPSASSASTPGSRSSSCSRTTSSASSSPSCASARAGGRGRSTSCCPRRSRSPARSAAARWACATSTCS